MTSHIVVPVCLAHKDVSCRYVSIGLWSVRTLSKDSGVCAGIASDRPVAFLGSRSLLLWCNGLSVGRVVHRVLHCVVVSILVLCVGVCVSVCVCVCTRQYVGLLSHLYVKSTFVISVL